MVSLSANDHPDSSKLPPSLSSSRDIKRIGSITKTRAIKRRHLDQQLKNSCDHSCTAGGLCFVCGCQISCASTSPLEKDDERVRLNYVLDNFSLTKEEFFHFRRSNYETNLIGKNKLCLILDLDNTLIHSIKIEDFIKEERRKHKSLYFLHEMEILLKLRPFLRTFLTEVSKLFELYIYTMGKPKYVNAIVNFLDPKEKHFDWRVITRYDCTTRGEKNLDVVLGGLEKAVVIVDDKECVWPKHKDNVLPIIPYYYWKKDQKRTATNTPYYEDGELEFMLIILKKLHKDFFNHERSTCIHDKDIRHLIKPVKKYYFGS